MALDRREQLGIEGKEWLGIEGREGVGKPLSGVWPPYGCARARLLEAAPGTAWHRPDNTVAGEHEVSRRREAEPSREREPRPLAHLPCQRSPMLAHVTQCSLRRG
eukprot:scaffold5713_cov124-Isochrysis_galbana.AAC.5